VTWPSCTSVQHSAEACLKRRLISGRFCHVVFFVLWDARWCIHTTIASVSHHLTTPHWLMSVPYPPASTTADREAALTDLLPFQRADFKGIFRAMDGRGLLHSSTCLLNLSHSGHLQTDANGTSVCPKKCLR